MKHTGTRRTGVLLTLLFIACLSSACNTIKGVGKDIRKGGEAIEKAAD